MVEQNIVGFLYVHGDIEWKFYTFLYLGPVVQSWISPAWVS